jgi:hypothetical protein
VILVWNEDSGKHTSSYIDDEVWKESISSAGIKQMNSLLNGKWNEDRWGELLERSEVFVVESGLLQDSLRLELLKEVEQIIIQLNSNVKPLLCLLGKSLVIVPKDIKNSNNLGYDDLIDSLQDAGFNTVKTNIAKLF